MADVTGSDAPDLLVNSRMYAPPLPGDDNQWGTAALIKEGLGTMKLTLGTLNTNVTVNAGTLEFAGEAEAGAGGGYGFVRNGSITVNSGATLSLTGSGTGFGWRDGNSPTSINIVGGTVTSGTNHIFDVSGGINMTGGMLDSTSGAFQLKGTNINTLASADTATIAGAINLRTDFGAFTQAVDVADGGASTDLLISANITQASANPGGITKSGAGTLELSGTNSYTGATTVSAGTLVLSGNSSAATGAITVNAGVLSLGDGTNPTNLSDSIAVSIASGAQVNLNFTGNEVVGSLDIDGSGPLPAGTYSATTGGYESFFTGTGSLEILAQDGTWTATEDGNWSDSANWDSNIIAVGTDNTATFNAATGVTVTLDSGRIIGNLAFDVSDYIIAGGNTLTLDTDSVTPVISVTTDRTATISAGLCGTEGLEKTGDGTLVLSGVKSYTGDTTVTAGTLEINSATADLSAVSGYLLVSSGATLKITGSDYTGLGRLGAKVNTLDVEGGTVENTIESWITGASVNLTGATMSGGRFQIISSGINSFDSVSTSTISSNLLIRKDYGSADLAFGVDDGAAATDLLVSGDIGQVLAAGVVKNGLGTLVFDGTNTYTGNTVVNDGVLEVTAASGLRFAPAGVATNSVSGTSTGTLSFLGTIDLDLAAADITNGNTWTLFDVGTLNSPTLTPAAVTSTTLGSFNETSPGSGVWELTDGANTWTFQESSGVLSLAVASGSDFDTWGDPYGLTTGDEGGDLDNDGVTNFEEYAFGLIPNSGSSVNPIAAQLDKGTGNFSYTRRTQSLTGLTYSVWYSTDLATWTEDTGAVEGTPAVSGEVETVPVTISGSLLTNPKLFLQVRAQ